MTTKSAPPTGRRATGSSGIRLGRPLSNNGTYDQGDVKIPDQNTLQKAREILDELRRRAGERFRPEIELDYIDRLVEEILSLTEGKSAPSIR